MRTGYIYLAVILVLASPTCCVFFESTVVVELGEDHLLPPMGGTMPREGAASSGIVGPPLGLPGYTASHTWDAGFDKFSPLVYDTGFFAANYKKAATRNQEQTETEWVQSLDQVYPNCKQASATFSPNAYFRANKQKISPMEPAPTCGNIVEHYLNVGIYDALQTYNAQTEATVRHHIASQEARVSGLRGDAAAIKLFTQKGEDSWTLNSIGPTAGARHGGQLLLTKSSENGTPLGSDGTVQYSYSMWMKLGSDMPLKAAVLQYGEGNDLSPAIFQTGKQLKVQVSLKDRNDFYCEPEDELSEEKYVFVALTVHKSVDVYYNGKLVKSCEIVGDSPKVLPTQKMIIGEDGKTDARVRNVFYYPGAHLSQELVQAQMTLQHMHDEVERAREERRERKLKKTAELKAVEKTVEEHTQE